MNLINDLRDTRK